MSTCNKYTNYDWDSLHSFFFCSKFLRSRVYFIYMTYLNMEKSYYKCLKDMCRLEAILSKVPPTSTQEDCFIGLIVFLIFENYLTRLYCISLLFSSLTMTSRKARILYIHYCIPCHQYSINTS